MRTMRHPLGACGGLILREEKHGNNRIRSIEQSSKIFIDYIK